MLIHLLLQGVFKSHVATLSDLHDVGAYIHVATKLIAVLLLIALVLSAVHVHFYLLKQLYQP